MKKFVVVLLMILVLFSAIPAQCIEFKGVSPVVGLIMPEDPWDTGYLLGASVNLGEVYPGLELHPFLTYWSTSYDYNYHYYYYNYDNVELTLSNLQLGADAHYKIPSITGLYVGGGLSVNFITAEAAAYGSKSSSDDTKIGLGALAGYEMPLGNNTVFAQVKYNIISDLDTLEISLGYYFNL